MNELINLLKNQTIESHNWINKLIQDVEQDKWFVTPETIETNLAWQLGHLTLSQYFYNVVLLNGPQKDFAEKINLKKYSALFANGSKRNQLTSDITFNELTFNWDLMKSFALETLSTLQDTDLNNETYKMPKPHPFVKTKENSISWNIKHNMWHCGHISTLRRIIGKPFNIGI